LGKPKFTFGKVVKVNSNTVEVEWDSVKGVKGWKRATESYRSHLKKVNPIMMVLNKFNLIAKNVWPIKTTERMFPILEIGSTLKDPDPNAGGNWPREFIEALIRPDWRL
jgi:hypothetical protein